MTNSSLPNSPMTNALFLSCVSKPEVCPTVGQGFSLASASVPGSGFAFALTWVMFLLILLISRIMSISEKVIRLSLGGLIPWTFFVSGCSNQPPSVPIVVGAQRGRPNETLQFCAVSVDREGDSISYFFSWNGNGGSEWSEWLGSGVEYRRSVVFADTGGFFLQVKARDRRQESGWSDTFLVSIRFYQPLVPHKPVGPDTAVIGQTVAFVSSALHPLDESLALQFDWGDTVGEWSGFVPPGTLVFDRHAYQRSGCYEVRCRARDLKGFISGWSLPETIAVLESFAPERKRRF